MLVDKSFVGGAGNFEFQCYNELTKMADACKDKKRMGIIAFADALLSLPKTLAKNSGFDP